MFPPFRARPFVLASVLVLIVSARAAAQDATQEGTRILDLAGVRAGLIVHLGAGDGQLTAALSSGDGSLVQGLDTDPARVLVARRYLQEIQRTGAFSVRTCDGRTLPYIDGVVNLLVVDDPFSVPREEQMRVLAPQGVLLTREGGSWRRRVKPRPAGLDAWPHFLHGADGNAVADDTAVDVPYHVQWVGAPRFARTHEGLSTVNVAVSDGRRLYYIADTATVALPEQLPTKWSLIARDAFNGMVLWQREILRWQARGAGSRHRYPPDLFRRLVAGGDRLYATIDILGPVVALDSASGEIRQTLPETTGAEEILLDGDSLYVVVNPAPTERIDRGALRETWPLTEPKKLVALDAASGEVRWTKSDADTLGLAPMATAVRGGRLVCQNPREIVCLDAADGRVLWRTARRSPEIRPVYGTPTLVLTEEVVLSADRVAGAKNPDKAPSELIAYAVADGRQLWRTPCTEASHVPSELFVVDDLVWVGEEPNRGKQDYRFGRDLLTGEVRRTMPDSDQWVSYHHHRCYRDKATSRFILAGRTGVEYLDVDSGRLTSHRWIRGICKFGVLPCNGLLYLPPNQCSCYNESLLNGFNALAPRRAGEAAAEPREKVLPGPAFGTLGGSAANETAGDWPTYRGNAARTGSTEAAAPRAVEVRWTTSLDAPLTAPVAADGRIFVAQIDKHTVHALDAESGEVRWSYTAAARVDSPPTVAGGLVVFGCRDGWVYALRTDDGVLAWQTLVAPDDRQLVAMGQLESVWPVHGSVLVKGDRVYCAAGRYSHLDGGVTCRVLDLETGRPLITRRFESRDAETGAHRSLYEPFAGALLPDRELPGVLPDVPAFDGEHLYLRSVAFDDEFQLAHRYVRHLFASAGFVDDAWYQRSFWIYGNHLFSGLAGRGFNKEYPSVGRILVQDATTVYGYRDYTADPEGVFAVEKNADLGRFTADYPPTKQKLKSLPKIDHGKVNRWSLDVPFYVRAMTAARDTVLLAGPPKHDPEAAHEHLREAAYDTIPLPDAMHEALEAWQGRRGGKLWIVDKADGAVAARIELASPPVHDGMLVAQGRVYMTTMDGSIVCLQER